LRGARRYVRTKPCLKPIILSSRHAYNTLAVVTIHTASNRVTSKVKKDRLANATVLARANIGKGGKVALLLVTATESKLL
jgi:ribosomal protein S4E